MPFKPNGHATDVAHDNTSDQDRMDTYAMILLVLASLGFVVVFAMLIWYIMDLIYSIHI